MLNGAHNTIFERTIPFSALVSLPLAERRFLSSPGADTPTRRHVSPQRRPADTSLPTADTPTRFSPPPTRRHADPPIRLFPYLPGIGDGSAPKSLTAPWTCASASIKKFALETIC